MYTESDGRRKKHTHTLVYFLIDIDRERAARTRPVRLCWVNHTMFDIVQSRINRGHLVNIFFNLGYMKCGVEGKTLAFVIWSTTIWPSPENGLYGLPLETKRAESNNGSLSLSTY